MYVYGSDRMGNIDEKREKEKKKNKWGGWRWRERERVNRCRSVETFHGFSAI
jgi:hypothetical protein